MRGSDTARLRAASLTDIHCLLITTPVLDLFCLKKYYVTSSQRQLILSLTQEITNMSRLTVGDLGRLGDLGAAVPFGNVLAHRIQRPSAGRVTFLGGKLLQPDEILLHTAERSFT